MLPIGNSVSCMYMDLLAHHLMPATGTKMPMCLSKCQLYVHGPTRSSSDACNRHKDAHVPVKVSVVRTDHLLTS